MREPHPLLFGLAAGANYGIAEYFKQVVDVVVRMFDIKNLHPTYPEVQEALTKLNRYLGPANVETAGAPVQGRSGGGSRLGETNYAVTPNALWWPD